MCLYLSLNERAVWQTEDFAELRKKDADILSKNMLMFLKNMLMFFWRYADILLHTEFSCQLLIYILITLAG